MRARTTFGLALAALLWASHPLSAQLPDSSARPARPAVPPVAPDTMEPVLLDIRLERSAAATVQAFRYRDQALIPVAEFLTLAEVQHTVLPDGRIQGVLQPESREFIIDGRLDTVVIGARKFSLRRTERLARDGEIYIDAEQLGPMFGIAFGVEWSDLLVTVNDAGPLPIAKRLRRARARIALMNQSRQQTQYLAGVPLGMIRPRADGAVLDYSITVPSQSPECGLSGGAAFGANILGGSLELTGTSGAAPGCSRRNEGQIGWTGVWMHNPWLRQVRIGEGITTGQQPRQVRGLSLSNTPYIREPEFGTARYVGFVGQAWEVEAYRAGGLVAVDTADTTGRFDIAFPISYGDNPVEFFAYGPYGEERRFGQSYRVVYELVPRNSFEYGLSGGGCPVRITCRTTGNADLRYGVTASWTARGGFDYIERDSTPDLRHPYARITGLITNALSLDLRATLRAGKGAELTWQPSVDRRLSASFIVYDTTVVSPVLSPTGVRSQWYMTGFYRPASETSPFFIQWDAQHQRNTTSIFQVLGLAPSYQTTHVRWMPRVRLERVAPFGGETTIRKTAGLTTFTFFPSSWGNFFGRLAASTNVELDADRPKIISVLGASFISRLRGGDMLLTTSFSWAPESPLLTTFSLQTNRAAWRGLTQAVLQTRNDKLELTASQSAQGSVVWNRRTSDVSLVAGPSLQRSGVTGRVYLDANGNGRFDGDDAGLPNVFVRAASSGGLTDSLGRFAIWDVPTFVRTTIAIDSATLESPLWIPAVPIVTIEAGPNHYRPIDIAILPGGSIDGYVVRTSGSDRLALPGVRVTLTNTGSAEKTTTVTFADGGYSFLGVRPGEYELSVDERIVARFAGTFTPRKATLRAERDGATLTDIELAIVTAPPVAVVIDVPVPETPVDSDRDGVLDPSDRCPNTPLGMRVDVAGCPILFGTTERTVTLRGVNFRTGSAVLTPGSLVSLDSVAATLLALPNVRVEVGGHTDSVGGAALNLRLSQARAQSVMRYLGQKGVPLSRMSAIGYGPRLPVAPNATAAGRALNRRVELRRIE